MVLFSSLGIGDSFMTSEIFDFSFVKSAVERPRELVIPFFELGCGMMIGSSKLFVYKNVFIDIKL